MNVRKIRRKMVRYAFQFVGTWYKWGGDDASGFDCSGILIEILKAHGALPRKYDSTANDLYWNNIKYKVNKPLAGCGVFYENSDGTIVHVEMCVDNLFAIGASGGGSKTLTQEDAIRDNAFIKQRPIKRTRKITGFIDFAKMAKDMTK